MDLVEMRRVLNAATDQVKNAQINAKVVLSNVDRPFGNDVFECSWRWQDKMFTRELRSVGFVVMKDKRAAILEVEKQYVFGWLRLLHGDDIIKER